MLCQFLIPRLTSPDHVTSLFQRTTNDQHMETWFWSGGIPVWDYFPSFYKISIKNLPTTTSINPSKLILLPPIHSTKNPLQCLILCLLFVDIYLCNESSCGSSKTWEKSLHKILSVGGAIVVGGAAKKKDVGVERIDKELHSETRKQLANKSKWQASLPVPHVPHVPHTPVRLGRY